MHLPTPEEIGNARTLKKLRVEIQAVLRTLVYPVFTAPLTGSNYFAVIKFSECLGLPGADTGRLPYWSGTDRASRPRKNDCVLAIVSCVVVDYWHLRDDPEDYTGSLACYGDPSIEERLDQLRYIVEHWDELEVVGNIRERYYLNIPEMEESEDEQIEDGPLRAEETEGETIQGA